ncbi:hypothetical protein C5167_042541 [Papaver somniferum]|uniref:DUF7803 domain-containing protein n=1 Tax=Papaver somniferum TaxID=3469 RepID=A0A4Y7L457_PAPSO|nr:hypothetical protein C5167_042541 [Papaver somniferum]
MDVDSEPSMDETILVGDDLMTRPSSPIIPPEIASHISSKENKHKKEVMLLAVNRKHSDYTSFKPEKLQPQMAADNSVSTASEGQPQIPTLEVVEIYKSSVSVNPILGALGVDI